MNSEARRAEFIGLLLRDESKAVHHSFHVRLKLSEVLSPAEADEGIPVGAPDKSDPFSQYGAPPLIVSLKDADQCPMTGDSTRARVLDPSQAEPG